VAAIHERKYKSWVANGNAWYVVYDQDRGWALELAARIRGMSRRKIDQPADSLIVAGHPAGVTWKTTRRGLPWKRHEVTFMTIELECSITERRLEFEFSGWCPKQGFDEIREAVQFLKCH
jgi:hypothetical protein